MGRDGITAAARVLSNMQLGQLSPDLWSIGRRLVESEHLFLNGDVLRTYAAKVLAEAVLDHHDDPQLASAVVRNVRSAVEGSAWGNESLKDILRFVARRYPAVVLSDQAFMDRSGSISWQFFIRNDDSDIRKTLHPIDHIEPAHLIAWVKADPKARAGQVAQVLTYAMTSEDSVEMTWTPVALDLIGIEETVLEVLQEFEQRFYLGSWTGSEANRYVRRRPLCKALLDHRNSPVRRWAREALRNLDNAVRLAEERERARNQSFE